jgi:LuxR family transcriptional regulator, maltose regulon positive regulatory protein
MTARPARHAAALGKLASPRLGRVFDRERLFGLLDGAAEAPALWLAAPPGAGKTTLAATWLRRRESPTLWLQLDAGDADPATFMQSLDALWSSLLAAPLHLPALRADDLADLPAWLRRRLLHVLPLLPPRWSLVLDNQQELPADSPLQQALAHALVHLPAGVQWVFISREPPPAAFAGALAKQQLALVGAEPLRLDDAETRALIRLHGRAESMAPTLAAAQGWAAGLTLMLLGTPSDAKLPALDAHERLFDYFAGEVLSRLPPEHQQALGMLAYLPSTTASLALAMSGCADAPALLEQLAASSLFTDRREGPPAVFVFHALFAQFLRRRFERTASIEQQRALLLRAGRLLIDAGETDAGLQRLIEAQAWDEAVQAVASCAPRYAADGRVQALRGHIDALPAAHAERLAYWRGWCALDSAPTAALADMVQAERDGAAAHDTNARLAAAAGAATALVCTGRVRDLDPWIELLTAHADHALAVQDDDTQMRLVPGLLSALVYRQPWHALTEPLAERAERLLHHESAAGQRLLLGALAFHLLWRGHVDRLERIVLRIDALCAQGLAAPATMLRWWGVGTLVKTLLGHTASARTDAQQALALIAAEPTLAPQRAAVELQAMFVALASVDAASARRHMEQAAQALHPDNAFDRTTYEHQRGMLALLEGDTPTALRLMRAAVASARASGFQMREHIALIANALAAAHGGERAEAQQALQQVFSHPMSATCRWHHWVGGCVAAYAALLQDDGPGVRQHLHAALQVARECGYRHGPMLFLCGDMMARLCSFALTHGIEPEIARNIAARNQLKAPPQADAAWPWAVRVQALGAFTVEVGGAPLASSRKESRRLLELLRVLAAHGNAPVAQDAVADALWPDADGDAARNALDNALHRLRKLLGGDDRIVLRQGALALNPQRCWSDVAALERTLGEIDRADASQRPALARRLQRLYSAPLLADNALALVARRREALHRQVQRALQHGGPSLPDL